MGDLIIGTVNQKNKPQRFVNMVNMEELESKHNNIVQCRISLDLLQKTHAKAEENKLKIESEKEMMIMALSG